MWPDQREVTILVAARREQQQRAVVINQLGYFADVRQHIGIAHHRAWAEAADGLCGLCGAKCHRRAPALARCSGALSTMAILF